MPGFPSTIIDTHTSSINYRSQASGNQLVCGEETVRDVSAKCNYGSVRRIIATSWTYTCTRKACTRERNQRYSYTTLVLLMTTNITVILKTIEFILISLNVNTDGCFYGLAAL